MTVGLDRALAGRALVFAAFLLWPLILFGRPTYLMGDSLAYLKTGQQAVEFVQAKLSSDAATPEAKGASDSPAIAGPKPAARGADTKTARSVTYSVAAYALRWPGQDLTGLAVVQILAASLLCAIVGGVLGLRRWRSYAAVAALSAFATPLGAFTAFAVPDIWAGIMLGAMALLIAAGDRLSSGVKLYLTGVVTFAISAHASIPPIAAGMAIIGVALFPFQHRFGLKMRAATLGWLLLPLLLGFGANVAINYISFGKASATGKRIPTALARSIAQGPGKWYLEEQCKVPRYAVCEIYGTKIPGTINGFLFDKNSLNDLATPEQMDRIRAQESEIVLHAALAYPGVEARKLSSGVLKQLIEFDLGLTNFKRRVEIGADGIPTLVETGRDHSALLQLVDVLAIILLTLSAMWVFLRYGKLDARERTMLLLLVLGMLGNALVCSAFSGVAERYQARIIWLLPVFILSMFVSRSVTETRVNR